MSYFDGIIPQACRSCFTWNGQNWIQADPGLCDECDYMLDMFPLVDGDKERERKAAPNCRGRQDTPGVDADGWRKQKGTPPYKGALPSTIVQLVYKNPSLVQASRRPL